MAGWTTSVVLIIIFAVTINLVSRWLHPTAVPVSGSCNARFKSVEAIFRQSLRSGLEKGAGVAVYHQGERVCDLWGGWADPTQGLPWAEDTVSCLFSTTKGVAAICLAVLFDRGLFDYQDRVANYWPDFAQNGKADVTIGMLASHQAGLAVVDAPIDLKMIKDDPAEVGRRLAAQKPNWTPGEQNGYHALTFGLYVDQLIRRIDPKQRSIQDFFREEIAIPYDIDLHIGLPRAEHWRAARFTGASAVSSLTEIISNPLIARFMYNILTASSDSLTHRAGTNPEFDITKINWPEYRETPQASVLGFGTARAVAKLYSIVVSGERQKKPLLSDRTLTVLSSEGIQRQGIVYGLNFTWGYGVFHLKTQGASFFGHPGYGGQWGTGSPELDLAWSYVTNTETTFLDANTDVRIGPIQNAVVIAARNAEK